MIRVKSMFFHRSSLRGQLYGFSGFIVTMFHEAIVGVGYTNYLLLHQKPFHNQWLKIADFFCSVNCCRVLAQPHISVVSIS